MYCTYNATLWRVRVTVWQGNKTLHSECVVVVVVDVNVLVHLQFSVNHIKFSVLHNVCVVDVLTYIPVKNANYNYQFLKEITF